MFLELLAAPSMSYVRCYVTAIDVRSLLFVALNRPTADSANSQQIASAYLFPQNFDLLEFPVIQICSALLE